MDGGPADPVRRRATALGAAALAVAAVVGVVVSVRLLGGGGDVPTPAPPVGSPTVSLDAPTTAPTTPAADLRRTVDAGDEQHWILALTADDFAHRRLREVTAGTEATPLGEGRFVLRDGWEGRELSIIDVADGSTTPVRVARTQAPVAADEVPVVLLDGASSSLAAVAPDGSGHEVPAPDGVQGLAAYGDRLTAVGADGDAVTHHWSDDGGATWQQAELPGAFLPWVADAGAGAPHVILEGGDGATLFPLLAVDTAPAADPITWTRDEVARDVEWPTVSGAWIDRAGGLRVLATIELQGARGPVDAGVWQVAGGRRPAHQGRDRHRRERPPRDRVRRRPGAVGRRGRRSRLAIERRRCDLGAVRGTLSGAGCSPCRGPRWRRCRRSGRPWSCCCS